jgi:hypothetical protein
LAIQEPSIKDKFTFAAKVREKLENEEKAQKTLQTTFLAKAKISELQRTIKIPRIFANHCKVEYMKEYLTNLYIKK